MSCMYVCCFTSNLVKTICFCDILKLFKTKFIQRTNSISLHIKICMKDEYYNSTSRLRFSHSEHERFQYNKELQANLMKEQCTYMYMYALVIHTHIYYNLHVYHVFVKKEYIQR